MGEDVRLLIVLAVVVTIGSATACGNGEAEEQARAEQEAAAQASEEAVASEAAAAEREAEEAAARRAQQRRYDSCSDVTTDLIDALSQVDSRLSIGLSNSEYGDYVGDARVEYDDLVDAVEDEELGARCLQAVAVPLENALDDHITVFNDWSDCINDFSCDFNEGDVNDRAQRGWLRASDRRDKAEDALEDLLPAD